VVLNLFNWRPTNHIKAQFIDPFSTIILLKYMFWRPKSKFLRPRSESRPTCWEKHWFRRHLNLSERNNIFQFIEKLMYYIITKNKAWGVVEKNVMLYGIVCRFIACLLRPSLTFLNFIITKRPRKIAYKWLLLSGSIEVFQS